MVLVRSAFPQCILPLMAMLAIIVATTHSARADVNDRGLYMGFRLLPAVSGADERLIGGQDGGGPFVQRGDDPEGNIGAGGMIGYHLTPYGLPLRAEVEYNHRLRLDFDTRETAPLVIGYKNDVDTDSVMFNLYFDLSNKTSWWPYVGVGIGWARHSSNVSRGDIATTVRETREESSDNFAFSLQAGIRVAITRSWVGEIGYRYIDMGKFDTGTFTTGDRVVGENYTAHDIVLGLVYFF